MSRQPMLALTGFGLEQSQMPEIDGCIQHRKNEENHVKNQKLKLDSLKVKSFVTEAKQELKGGYIPDNTAWRSGCSDYFCNTGWVECGR